MKTVSVCANCVAWKGAAYQDPATGLMIAGATLGECRMHYPDPNLDPQAPAIWKQVRADDWCHGWKQMDTDISHDIPV
jgi:hypothetical protein